MVSPSNDLISILPHDINFYLLSYVDKKSLLALQVTSKHFKNVCNSNALWLNFADKISIPANPNASVKDQTLKFVKICIEFSNINLLQVENEGHLNTFNPINICIWLMSNRNQYQNYWHFVSFLKQSAQEKIINHFFCHITFTERALNLMLNEKIVDFDEKLFFRACNTGNQKALEYLIDKKIPLSSNALDKIASNVKKDCLKSALNYIEK